MHDFLKQVEFFWELSEPELEHLCQIVKEVRLAAGQELFAEGSPGDMVYIIREGDLEIVKHSDGREILLEVHRNKPGQVVGEMSLLEDSPRMASARASTDAVLVAIGKDDFRSLLDTNPAVSRAMVRIVLRRWRSNEARLHQSEKMAQLGTFTAGIAHELNNPAAAVKRTARQLETVMAELGQAQAQLVRLNLSAGQQETLDELARQAREHATEPLALDALELSDREAELEVWLEEQEVANAWELAPALASMDYDPSGLAALVDQFSAGQLAVVLGWLNCVLNSQSLLLEIGEGAERISQIVQALKIYSYLDQAPVQTVDVHEGLNSALLILRHKLKAGVRVRREYDEGLPRFSAYGSELNQVWTNLIDNAIDAMAGQGEIIIRTRQENDYVVVEIEDTGPGIPPEIQSRVFDPFFTTKPPGQGTGLGLDISYNIIVRRHRGDIKLFSEPGRTCFQIWLPLRQNPN